VRSRGRANLAACDARRGRASEPRAGLALRKTAASLPRKPISLPLDARRLRGHADACRRLPLFLELSGGGGASRPRKVVHYFQPCAGTITRLCAWRRSHALSFFLFVISPLFLSSQLRSAFSPSRPSAPINPSILISFKRYRPNHLLDDLLRVLILYRLYHYFSRVSRIRDLSVLIFTRSRLYES